VKVLTNITDILAGKVTIVEEDQDMKDIPNMSWDHLRPLLATYKHFSQCCILSTDTQLYEAEIVLYLSFKAQKKVTWKYQESKRT
jgi:hypothetical protein